MHGTAKTIRTSPAPETDLCCWKPAGVIFLLGIHTVRRDPFGAIGLVGIVARRQTVTGDICVGHCRADRLVVGSGDDLVAIKAEDPAAMSRMQTVIVGNGEISRPGQGEHAGPVSPGDGTCVVR